MSLESFSTNDKSVYSREYTLQFGDVLSRHGTVNLVDHINKTESKVGISIDDRAFQCRTQKEFPSIIADLIDLAVAVHVSDRLAVQNLRQQQTRIHAVLPVRHPEILNKNSFRNQLCSLLEWATGSRWTFEFSKRMNTGRIVEQQLLIESSDPYVDEVTLWSGGLDALAGLYTHLKEKPEISFMLFGTGSNENASARQEQVFQALQPSFPNRLNLCRVPIRFSESNLHTKNKISRARGIVFTLLGSACAYLMGRRVLHLYENGIGAINLPYRKSAVGLDHSRSVHPLTLVGVSNLISELIGEEFGVRNPFLFWTKAEMCKQLAEDANCDLPSLTTSCDSPHRKQPIQCGYCSSCILRKQSLAASRLKDQTRYIVPHGARPAGDIRLYLQHMLAQVSTLKGLLNYSENATFQWKSLTKRFPELDDIVDRTHEVEGLTSLEMRKRLIGLYQTYISEWDTVEPQISGDFLNKMSVQQVSQDFQLATQ
ncbi:7-cyano-7-deazaguanine synthase [Nodosilinea sp. LEGE 07298]|uniref:7-cyano-7-deazaguanine synthase n=1 Tax=Nodosilinea sp. LEGE 07298 TaxID=2777970 RepID=UPI00187ECE41|nr:7-cyano-7-deazaguanine synthase [Nodosilinea sp. LEGE 07298]MBE9112912.1 7-cyano-7-deazaguanine synthase [Nodosilinea sp. LEGE 07298]